MSIFNYVKRMLPTFTLDVVKSDIRMVREDIEKNILPSYMGANSLLRGKQLMGRYGRELDNRIRREVPDMRGIEIFESTRRIFMNVNENLAWLEREADRLFSRVVTKESMTYRRAAFLAYLDSVRFATRYATRSLDRILANEVDLLLKRDKVDQSLSKHEIEWFAKNNNSYLLVLKTLNQRSDAFRKSFEETPDVNVHEEGGAGAGLYRQNFINFEMTGRFNLLYHVRMGIAEWQVSRHRAREEERRMLELRILRLKEAMDGTNDPKLQQAIEYNEGRLKSLNAQIEDIENRYGDPTWA